MSDHLTDTLPTLTEGPTMDLRWRAFVGQRVLQQRWIVTRYGLGVPPEIREEWRDVPEVEEQR